MRWLLGSAAWVGGLAPWQILTDGAVEPEPPERVRVFETESLGVSAHSFLQQAIDSGDFGNLGGYWSGDILINYMGFSSIEDRWNSNGVDRTGDYSGALLLTEIGDLATGLAEPNSPAGVATYQNAFNFAVTARAKGCKLVGLYPPHSPEGSDLDLDSMRKMWRLVLWLRARPELDGLGIFLIPAPVLVRAAIDRAAPESIFADGLHLRTPAYPAPNQTNNALAQMIKMFLIGERVEDDPSWNQEMRDLVEVAWTLVRDYECTGLGGQITIEPWPITEDPLPSPSSPFPVTMLTPPSLYPDVATIGDNITLSLGTYANAVGLTGALVQGGIDRTSEIVDGVWSPGVAGSFTWTVTATGGGGPIITTVSGTVTEAQPEVQLKDIAYLYIDQDTPYSGSPSEVTGILAEGTGGLNLTVTGTGSPNMVTRTEDGFRFGQGRYMTITGLSPDAADGALLMIDATFETVTGTATMLNYGGGLVILRRASANAQVVAGDGGTPAALTVATVTAGQRVILAVDLNRAAQHWRTRNPVNGQITTAARSVGAIAPTSLTIGQGTMGTLHRAVIVNRPGGREAACTLEDLISGFPLGE